MAPQIGMTEFFGMEAGEYLERLDTLLSPGGTPDGDEFVRLTRALRGSALMANQQSIAAAAAGLEAVARALRESRLSWQAASKQIAIRAVDDLKILIRSLAAWSAREDATAQGMAQELEQLAGGRVPGRPPARGPDTGTRAFVAREGAALASELDRVAVMLGQNPSATGEAAAVLKTMQPLRGVAGVADLPPLPDILDAIERAAGLLSRSPELAAPAAAMFRVAAQALARAAREAAQGALATDAPELAELADRLREMEHTQSGAVPIETLYFDDAGPHVLQAGTPSAAPDTMARVELVSHGDHLKQAAAGLEHAASPAQRELRAQALGPTLRSLGAAGGAVATFAAAAREAVARVAALRDPTPLITALRDAGTVLSRATAPHDADLGDALTPIAASLRHLAAGPARPTPATPAAQPRTSAPTPAPAPVRASGPVRATATGTGSGPTHETPDLPGSLLRARRLDETLGVGPASIEALLAGPPEPGAPTGAVDRVVAVQELCYDGPAALQRALSLREQVRAALGTAAPQAQMTDLIEEIFDLLQLGQPRGS